MTTKDMTPETGAHLPAGWQAASDEIDLRELVLLLWRQKGLILLITALFAVAGVGYALTAPQQWSAKAVITGPKQEDLLPMQKVSV